MVTVDSFGCLKDGRETKKYTIENSKGSKVILSDYRALIVGIVVKDKNGVERDVVLGYDDASGYENGRGWFGAVVGRYANRLRNGKMILSGMEYTAAINEKGITSLHGGGEMGIVVFDAKCGDNAVLFTAKLEDGKYGFPGALEVSIRYTFDDDNKLEICYSAKSNKKTVVNLTNHAYFNFNGHDGANIENHILKTAGEFYLPVDENCLPTGEVLSVKGTPFDFTQTKRVGEQIDDDNEQLAICRGYDHTLVFRKSERGAFEWCAKLSNPDTGISMDVYTTCPGVQLYTGNSITDGIGKNGVPHTKRSGMCLETHYFPDSMYNVHFPTPVIRAGEEFYEKTAFVFSVE